MGFGIMLGMFGTGVMAVAVTGTIKTWTANEKLTASDLNTTISSLKTAIESIPNWTKNGTSAYYFREGQDLGFIGQEAEKVIPEVISNVTAKTTPDFQNS